MLLRLAANVAQILFRPRRARALPVYLHVEPTNRCHLTCIGCARDVVVKQGSDLPFEAFQKLVDEVRPSHIALNGIGEPVLHPRFFDMVRYARSKGARVNTTSSMVLPESAFEAFVSSGLDLLKVSIDGASPATYQKLRGRDLFDRVLHGVDAVRTAKRKLRSETPALRFNCLLVEDTIGEMEAVIELARAHEVGAIYFQPLETSSVEVRTHPLISRLDYAGFRQAIERAGERARALGIESNLPDLLARFPVFWGKYRADGQEKPDTTVCPMPWYSLYVNASGMAQPCCKFSRYGERHGALGNVIDQGFARVWNAAEIQQVRSEFGHGVRSHKICQECVANGPAEMLGQLKRLPRFGTIAAPAAGGAAAAPPAPAEPVLPGAGGRPHG